MCLLSGYMKEVNISDFISTARSGIKNDPHTTCFRLFSNENEIGFVRMLIEIGSPPKNYMYAHILWITRPHTALRIHVVWHPLVKRVKIFSVRVNYMARMAGTGAAGPDSTGGHEGQGWLGSLVGHSGQCIQRVFGFGFVFTNKPTQPCLVDIAESSKQNLFL